MGGYTHHGYSTRNWSEFKIFVFMTMVRGADENFDDADYERLYAWSNLIAIQFFKEKFQMLIF